MHVAYFEARAFARQAARSKRRNAPLVRDFGERVVLVHELRQLARAEKFLDRRGHGLRVDHVLRHQAFAFRERQPLFHRAFDADQTDPELVLRHFADRTHPTVAEVVDVVDGALAVADLDQRTQYVDDVLRVEHARAENFFAAEATVELHATNGRQVVAFRREEQVVEQVLRRFLRRRLAGAHHSVDFDQRFQAVARRVDTQRVGDVRTAVEFVRVDRFDRRYAGFEQFVQHFVGDDRVAGNQDFAGVLIDDVARDHAVEQVFTRHVEAAQTGFLQQPHVSRRNPAADFDDRFAFFVFDFERRNVAAHPLGNQVDRKTVFFDVELVRLEEHLEHLLGREIERAQQDRRRQLAATVDTHEHAVFRIEFEIEPRTAVGNHAAVVQQLS